MNIYKMVSKGGVEIASILQRRWNNNYPLVVHFLEDDTIKIRYCSEDGVCSVGDGKYDLVLQD